MTATLRPRRLTAPVAPRLTAAAIDLAAIITPSLAVAVLASQRFPLLDQAAGPGRLASADQRSLDQITQGLHWTIESNGQLHVLDRVGLTVAAVTLVVTALTTHVGFPALGDGRSPGKGLTGLRVVAATGRRASAAQHLARAFLGPLDLVVAPFTILGARAMGRTDPRRRRLGDRLARTRVIREPRDWVVAPGQGANESEPSDPADASSASRTAPTRPTAAPERPVTITLPDTGPVPEPSIAATARGARSAATDTVTERTATPIRPAPPLLPTRRLDGSATRSPLARTGATRADMAGDRWASSPDTAWIGDQPGAEDGPLGPEDGLVTAPRRTADGSGFHALVLPESSLAEGSSAVTRAEVRRQRSSPAPNSPNCS